MNSISDLALDLGQFELDYELESGMERAHAAPAQLAWRRLRAGEFHQESLNASEKVATMRQGQGEHLAC